MHVHTEFPAWPDSLRYFFFIHLALMRGGCPVADALLIEGAFYKRYYELEGEDGIRS